MQPSEVERVINWLKNLFETKKQDKAIVAVSGGVDSAVVLTLITAAVGKGRVVPLLLPYGEQEMGDARLACEFNGLGNQVKEVNIKPMVERIVASLQIDDSVRKGNVMARVRMITLFDVAKASRGLVVGTENKSERELGYYTRFGDSASDVEPIVQWYKTQVWEVAKQLGLPEIFWLKKPSAELWEGQTDEGEMGFSYQDADRVLRGDVIGIDKAVVARVQKMVEANKFKREVPYLIE